MEKKNPPRAANCVLARRFPVPRTQPQVSRLTHLEQMLFNADSQWLLVSNCYLLLSPALLIHLEILIHIWEILLISASLGSDVLLQKHMHCLQFQNKFDKLGTSFGNLN